MTANPMSFNPKLATRLVASSEVRSKDQIVLETECWHFTVIFIPLYRHGTSR